MKIMFQTMMILMLVLSRCFAISTPTIDYFELSIVNDSDSDGVEDSIDLCPNTPTSTVVNKHGCPIELLNCDYNNSSVTFSTITPPPVDKQTRYLLVDAKTTNISQISTNSSFSGIMNSNTYMVVAFSYQNDGSVTGLVVGQPLSQVSAACADFSRALSVKICSPFIESQQCDFTTSDINLKILGVPQSDKLTKYVLVNSADTIVQLSELPRFTNLSGIQYYNAYALTYTNDNSISNLSKGMKLSNVTANCLDWSNPLPIKVCICNPLICVPITVEKTKNKSK